jgi:cell division protein ZapA (FtsZ GTPase activity inhibitor)
MRRVTVDIMGRQLEVNTDDGEDLIEAVTATVNQKIREVRTGGRAVNSVDIVIQAALNLAEELELLRRDYQAMIRRLQGLRDSLTEAVEH